MKIVGLLFGFYRAVLSPAAQAAFDIRCRHEETCSRYAERMMRERGFGCGVWLGLKRIAMCNRLFAGRT